VTTDDISQPSVKDSGSSDVQHTITESSRTTIGAAIAIAGVGMTACLWLNNTISAGQRRQELDHLATQSALAATNERLARLESSIADRWTETEMRAWVREFRASNPSTIVVPAIDGR